MVWGYMYLHGCTHLGILAGGAVQAVSCRDEILTPMLSVGPGFPLVCDNVWLFVSRVCHQSLDDTALMLMTAWLIPQS